MTVTSAHRIDAHERKGRSPSWCSWVFHLDIKRLGRFERVDHRITGDRTGQSSSRGVGWEYVHFCIDDASRIAFPNIFPTRRR